MWFISFATIYVYITKKVIKKIQFWKNSLNNFQRFSKKKSSFHSWTNNHAMQNRLFVILLLNWFLKKEFISFQNIWVVNTIFASKNIFGNTEKQATFFKILWKNYFLQNSTFLPFMSMVSDFFSQKSITIVHKKMPYNHLQETLFTVELSVLLFEICCHKMLQTIWIILYLLFHVQTLVW